MITKLMKNIFFIFLLITSTSAVSLSLCPFFGCDAWNEPLIPRCKTCNYVVALADHHENNYVIYNYRKENCSKFIESWENKCDQHNVHQAKSIFSTETLYDIKVSKFLSNELTGCEDNINNDYCYLC
jgi:hypothetical protein